MRTVNRPAMASMTMPPSLFILEFSAINDPTVLSINWF